MTVWDNIMLRRDTKTHHVKLNKKNFEYPIIDAFKSLPGKEIKYVLHWEHMPVIGPILKHEVELKTIKLPETPTSQPSKFTLRREVDYEDEDIYG